MMGKSRDMDSKARTIWARLTTEATSRLHLRR